MIKLSKSKLKDENIKGLIPNKASKNNHNYREKMKERVGVKKIEREREILREREIERKVIRGFESFHLSMCFSSFMKQRIISSIKAKTTLTFQL